LLRCFRSRVAPCRHFRIYRLTLILDGAHTSDKFRKVFSVIRNRYLQGSFDFRPGSLFEVDQADPVNALNTFIYELFENSYRHGRYDEKGDIIPGIRFINLRKRIAINFEQLKKRANGFGELQEYLAHVAKGNKTLPTFYEISIADSGLGIIKKFLSSAAGKDYRADSVEEERELLNTIIENHLSSTFNNPGSGYGLQRTLRAVDELKGFLSLRTGRHWLYKSLHTSEEHGEWKLSPVSSSEGLPPVVGTHFNMLFPLSL